MMKKSTTRQMIAGFSATITAFTVGFHIGWVAPSLPKLLTEDSDVTITSDEGSWIVNSMSVGYLLGPLISLVLVDRWGRKWSLIITVIPYLTSAILLGTAQSFWMLVAARFIGGLGVGMSVGGLPVYLGEIAEDSIRGAVCSLITQMMNAGILLTYCIGPWVSRVALACLGGLLPVLFVLMFFWMPDSPYFLLMIQRPDEAEKSLSWLRATTDVKEELDHVQKTIEYEKINSGTVKDLFMVSGNRKALVIVVVLVLAQQLCGFGVILSYCTLIFEASESTMDSNISVIVIGATQVLSGVLTIFIVDLTGRRPLLLFSMCGLIVFLVGEALYFQLLAAGTDVSSLNWLPLTCMISFVILYTISLGPLPFITFAEVIPSSVKAPAFVIVIVAVVSSTMAATKLYQVVADANGIHIAFWAFAASTVFLAIFLYFALPETKNKSLMEIQQAFHGMNTSSKS